MKETKSSVAIRPKWYQRTLLVNSKVQYVFLIYGFGVGMVLFSTGALFATIINRAIQLHGVSESLTTLDIILVLALMAILFGCAVAGLIVSNRLAGPITRVIREMEKAKNGQQLEKITFRSNDFFLDFAKAYNDIVDQIHKIENRKDVDPTDKM